MEFLTLHQSQISAVKDSHRFRVWNCGRRWGKTTAAVEEIVACAVSKPNQVVAYIAPTHKQARDIAWEMLRKKVRPVAENVNESRLEVIVKTKGGGQSKILFRGWESIENLRGMKFHLIVLDEVASMRHFWSGWYEVLVPALTDTKGSALFISTPKGFNHFYELFNIAEEDDDWSSHHFTTYDNPFVEDEEIEKLKRQLPEDKFAQEYLADFRKAEGLVYKEFNRARHVTDEMPSRVVSEMAGVDFGYTNPAAVLFIKIDHDNHWWIWKELYRTQMTTEAIIEAIQQENVNMVYPDPAEPDRIAMMKQNGLNVRDVSKDVVAGIDKVREMFKQGRIHIHPRCKNLIAELETYSYPEEREGGNNKEKPLKENDHACDALRYPVYSHKPRPVFNQFSSTKQRFV